MADDDPGEEGRAARPAENGERPGLEIRFTDLHWLEGQDERIDLCAHGSAFVRIGGDIVCEDLDTAVGAAVLNLLRTLREGHIGSGGVNCLLPHCGHGMFAVDGGEGVVVLNCFIGADWTVCHAEDGTIVHKSERGHEVRVGRDDYQKLVFGLADQVEAFYRDSAPKALPGDRADREGYEAFWREWRRRRQGPDEIKPPSRRRWGGLFRKKSGKKGETAP
jgi:hypothetical protein